MANVLQISEAASLAIHSMCILAKTEKPALTSSELAARLKASRTHLSKVMRHLVKARLLFSSPGPTGGFSLQKKSSKISLLNVYEAVEGKFIPCKCLVGKPVCSGKKCVFGGLLSEINEKVKGHFERTYLSSLTDVFGDDENGKKESKLKAKSKKREKKNSKN
ncbi:MAG: Rrf2 family transcriptional regulator [Planctomycetota bacterium]|nr:Rrf2 family transcriptional regulator [Planctomycetota bacterium]